MKKIVSPKFILLFLTLPQLLSLVYAVLKYSVIIETSPVTTTIAISAVAAIDALFTVYSVVRFKKEAANTKIFIALSVVYTLLITGALLLFESSGWLYLSSYTNSRLVFILACTITVIYGIYGIVCNTTMPEKSGGIIKYVAGIIAVPLIWFIGFNLLFGMNSSTGLMILIIAGVFAMLFMLIKMAFVLKIKKSDIGLIEVHSTAYYITAFIITLFMPFSGLLLNQSTGGLTNTQGSAGLFGDFSNPAFYIIALLNGILFLIPTSDDRRIRFILFFLKAACYTYILYFFAVFLPMLPLGFLGLVVYGLGIYVFAPFAATVFQGFFLIREFVLLSRVWGKIRVSVVLLAGLITIPACMTISFWGDRINFAAAVQYLQPASTMTSKDVNLNSLKRTLDSMSEDLQLNSTFNNGRGFLSGNIPMISEFYNYIVLDGKVLAQDNLLRLENLFFNKENVLSGTPLSTPAPGMKITDITCDTRYDQESGAYKTWVNLSVQNQQFSGNGEFVTTFKLPEGAYISDYYLDVNGTRKSGILAERQAALMTYRKITTVRKDPGLLHYVGPNDLELRVFPLLPGEIRKTGFEIIHQEKFNFVIDDKTVAVGVAAGGGSNTGGSGGDEGVAGSGNAGSGNARGIGGAIGDGNASSGSAVGNGGEVGNGGAGSGDTGPKEFVTDGAVLLPAELKTGLKQMQRNPKYYFIVDCSENSDISWNVSQVDAYAKDSGITNAAVIFTSYKTEEHSLTDMNNVKFKAECGFNLNAAIQNILRNESENYPVIITVTENMPAAVFPKDIYSLSAKFPESQYYYSLNNNLKLTPYSFEDNKPGAEVKSPVLSPVLDYKGNLVSNNGQSELVLTDVNNIGEYTGKQYTDAVILEANRKRMFLKGQADTLVLTRASFRAKILTPETAFIVVESTQQEKDLLDLQKKILNKEYSDIVPTVTLDEPPVYLYIAVLIVLVLLRYVVRELRRNRNIDLRRIKV